jgi:hypothetical protein
MRVKVFMATLAVTLMLGVQGYANPCAAACVDPFGHSCDRVVVRNGDLFSGLKRLVNGVRITQHCDPCDPVVACNPCDFAAFDPCDAVCAPRFGLGLGDRLRNLLGGSALCNPCDAGPISDPCEVVAWNCDPCGEVDFCGPPRLSLRDFNPFRNLRLNRGCVTDCDPFDACGPCDVVAKGPCDFIGGPCDFDNGCADNFCGPRGYLFDLPRLNLSRLFGNIRAARCAVDDCGPCDAVRPCDFACCR